MTKSTYKSVDQHDETELVVVDAERVNDDAPSTKDAYSDYDSTVDGEENDRKGNMVARGAAALCGLTGCFLGGPFLAILAAIGGAYSATHNEGPVGDASRAVGEVALAARDKAKEHQVCEKTGTAAKSVAKGLKESFRRKSTSSTASQNPKAEVL
mmetsp:Transcript_14395/g.30980  ORF Transcript_14395/g.30980 Transcript_14395/m.30980 type:complete len:155 (-) Transcript_14395:884-1348(-)|eukprot:CAMPEP_0178522780 /NCGR_PEP_ID=MMETSP0696-20121128/28729_1 /TAXON_ID=265572 /ORGANISM="Extubocellulus spinifer, Strain CCMP396" /LENGTH=154 /DNA_ID=CAMNT_0020153945 /DNA_START=60 /DNA_END=524 /DNA_ORIENTATION=+